MENTCITSQFLHAVQPDCTNEDTQESTIVDANTLLRSAAACLAIPGSLEKRNAELLDTEDRVAEKTDRGFRESLPAVQDDRKPDIAPTSAIEAEEDSSTPTSVNFPNEGSKSPKDSAVTADLASLQVSAGSQDDIDSQPIIKRQRKARVLSSESHAQNSPGPFRCRETADEMEPEADNGDRRNNSTRLPCSQSHTLMNSTIVAHSLTPSGGKTPAHPQSLVQNDTLSSTENTSASIAKVFFTSSTNIDAVDGVMKCFQKIGGRKVDLVTECDYVCIGKGGLKKTTNMILAITTGKLVLSEGWVKQCANHRKLLDPIPFLVEDPTREAEWGIRLADAIALGRQRFQPFAGYTLLITPHLKQQLSKSFAELKVVAQHGGASKVQSRLPVLKDNKPATLVISCNKDPDRIKLDAEGWACYTKDFVTITVLRSTLDLESGEFVIGSAGQGPIQANGPRGQKRKR